MKDLLNPRQMPCCSENGKGAQWKFKTTNSLNQGKILFKKYKKQII